MKKIGLMKLRSSLEIDRSPVSIGFECLDREMFRPECCYDTLGKTGVKLARVQTGWAKTEHEKGVYDFAWLDDIVDNLLSRGIQPWFNVGFGNPIYMPDVPNPTGVGCVPIFYGDEVTEAWLSFVRAAAVHYKGRVKSWEIWNESNIDHFWYPEKPDPLKYAHLVTITGAVIREVLPDARIGACVSGFANENDYTGRFARAMKSGDLHFFCYHSYGMYPERLTPYIARLREIMNEAGHINVDIDNGEGGYPSWVPKNHWLHPRAQTNERQQAVWQLRRYFLDMAAGAKMISFFQMADMMEKPYDKAREVLASPARHGIVNGKIYTTKKSCETLSRLANLMSGDFTRAELSFAGTTGGMGVTDPCTNETYPVQLMTFTKNGYNFYAYYLPAYIEDETPTRYDFAASIGETLADPVLLDMFTGEVFSLESLTGLPIAEYPMVICRRDAVEIEV